MTRQQQQYNNYKIFEYITNSCHNDDIINPKQMTYHKQDLTLPYIKAEEVEYTTTYKHAYREGGIRLEQEDINDKHIFHNYGQGLAEFSLAYGCSYICSKMITLKKELTKTKNVAVIGTTINALMTTLQLLKRGHRVTLYSQKFPIKNVNGKKQIEHSSGLQFWYPGDYDNCDPLKHELVSKLSYQFFVESLQKNRYQSLKWVNVYAAGPKAEQIRQNVTDFITKQINQTNVHFGNQKLEEYTCFRTILIDTELFTEEVFTELKLRNITLVQKKFTTLQDVLDLKQEFIFNCLSDETKKIFGDNAVRQIKGFYISLKRQLPLKDGFVIWKSSQMDDQEDFVVYVTNKKIHIGSRNKFSEQDNQTVDKLKDKLFSRAYHFLKQRTIKSYKL